MANFRMIPTAFVAVLCLSIPSLASAQRVHEVRPAPEGEVRIGIEANASMNDVVSLARRISGNDDLTAEDVVANNDHVRYVCRAHGRMLYFGTDSAYGGDRCPEDATRSRGVLRNAVYRVPRSHGETLPPRVPQTRLPTVAAPVANTAEVNSLRQQLAAADQSVFALQAEIDRLNEELEDARAEARAASQVLPEVEFIYRTVEVPGRQNVPWWLPFTLGIALMLVFYGLYYRERTLRPFRAYIKRLEGELKDEKDALKAIDQDRLTAEAELALLKPKIVLYERGHRIGKIWLHLTRQKLASRDEELSLSEGQRASSRESEATFRTELVERNTRIGVLREQDERAEHYRLQILEYRDQLAHLKVTQAEVQPAQHYELAIIQAQKDLEKLKLDFDPVAVKKELEHLLDLQSIALHELTGIQFDGTSTDRWRAEIEAQTRQQLHAAEAKKASFDALVVILKQEHDNASEKLAGQQLALLHGNEQELAEAKRRLEEEYTPVKQKLADAEKTLAALRGDPQARGEIIFAMETKIADLQRQFTFGGSWNDPVPSDPPPPEESISDDGNSERPIRQRRVTDAFVRTELDISRASIHGTPPLRKEMPMLASIAEFLTAFSQSGNGSSSRDKLIKCSEHEARDVAYLLHNFHIESPLLEKPVVLRKFARKLEHEGKTALLERRWETVPPPAPSYG